MLLPMIEQAAAYRDTDTLITADAGYHSDANVAQLMAKAIPAMIVDNQMRQSHERFQDQAKHKAKVDVLYDKQPTGPDNPIKRVGPQDFRFHDNHIGSCPAGQTITR